MIILNNVMPDFDSLPRLWLLIGLIFFSKQDFILGVLAMSPQITNKPARTNTRPTKSKSDAFKRKYKSFFFFCGQNTSHSN
jgi:hypothetical protein